MRGRSIQALRRVGAQCGGRTDQLLPRCLMRARALPQASHFLLGPRHLLTAATCRVPGCRGAYPGPEVVLQRRCGRPPVPAREGEGRLLPPSAARTFRKEDLAAGGRHRRLRLSPAVWVRRGFALPSALRAQEGETLSLPPAAARSAATLGVRVRGPLPVDPSWALHWHPPRAFRSSRAWRACTLTRLFRLRWSLVMARGFSGPHPRLTPTLHRKSAAAAYCATVAPRVMPGLWAWHASGAGGSGPHPCPHLPCKDARCRAAPCHRGAVCRPARRHPANPPLGGAAIRRSALALPVRDTRCRARGVGRDLGTAALQGRHLRAAHSHFVCLGCLAAVSR